MAKHDQGANESESVLHLHHEEIMQHQLTLLCLLKHRQEHEVIQIGNVHEVHVDKPAQEDSGQQNTQPADKWDGLIPELA
jgi:hypothetical protein